MPEYDNDSDRLEQFFRKAAGKPDVSFNEEDWKKLEEKLDARDALVNPNRAAGKIAGAVVAVTLLLFTGTFWLNEYRLEPDATASQTAHERAALQNTDESGDVEVQIPESTSDMKDVAAQEENPGEQPVHEKMQFSREKESVTRNDQPDLFATDIASGTTPGIPGVEDELNRDTYTKTGSEHQGETAHRSAAIPTSNSPALSRVSDDQLYRDLIVTSPAIAEKIKQKAVVELPGAEEAETSGAEAVIREEHASDEKKHGSLPRLSLLLSFAPDFSSTTFHQYSSPGRAFGAMVHYHFLDRLSVSVGVVKNYKKYSGAGEDYQPPKGYWKYYTNGIIPSDIDGSCNVLEFPLMVQYTVSHNGKNRWLAGAGVSSYLMLNESYKYHFEQPNPGAKEGWDSKSRSDFMFNMMNFSIGYERQITPGLMLGIEPYAKIPIEKIGWSNLKLFSTGASITLRYTVLRKKIIAIPSRGRGPD